MAVDDDDDETVDNNTREHTPGLTVIHRRG